MPTKQLIQKQLLDTNNATDLAEESEKGKDKGEESNDDAWLEAYIRAEKERENSEFPRTSQRDALSSVYPPNIMESTVCLFSFAFNFNRYDLRLWGLN